jgi:hypothetical protein
MSERERRAGETLEDYIRRLEMPDTEVMDAEQRRQLARALANAREAQRQAGWPQQPPKPE